MSVIAGVRGELPPHRYTQSEVTQALLALPGWERFDEVVRSLHDSAKVDSRYLVLPHRGIREADRLRRGE